MTQMSGPNGSVKIGPRSNIYTVLVAVAAAALLAGIVVIEMRNHDLNGTLNPFEQPSSTSAR